MHSVKVTLIADQVISLIGSPVDIHDIESIALDHDGHITSAALKDSTTPQTTDGKDIAREHWDWVKTWLEMVYIDAFVHGYKHGKRS